MEEVSLKIIELYKDFNINHVDNHGDSALSAAISMGLYKTALELTNNPECKLDFINEQGDTPLLMAINWLGEFHQNEDADELALLTKEELEIYQKQIRKRESL